MPEGEFAWTDLKNGDRMTFKSFADLKAFLDWKEARTVALAGSGEPQEKIEGWPEPAAIPPEPDPPLESWSEKRMDRR